MNGFAEVAAPQFNHVDAAHLILSLANFFRRGFTLPPHMRYHATQQVEIPSAIRRVPKGPQAADVRQRQLEAVKDMISRITTGIAAGAMLIAGFAAEAQESTNRVAAKTDWSVFVEENPTECWGVSSPKATVNTRDGKPASVTRGDILLFVTFRPGISGEVSFTGGYPFAGGSTVSVAVDGSDFELFTEGEWAWPASPEDDAKLVTALKRGSEATLTGRSARGTITKDTFSLMGFTAAMDEAEKRCVK
jgi:hypothetical protein